MLATYLTQVQNLLGTGPTGNLFNNSQLIGFINEARRHVASRGQCVRQLSPVAGPISSILITATGSGYLSAPTIAIAGPDFPLGNAVAPTGISASAIATISGAQLQSITLLSSGGGYFSPGVSITNGSPAIQATAVAIVSNISQTTIGQEVYPYSQFLQCIQSVTSGVQSIVAIKSVAILYGTFRYVEMKTSFSKYQALVRTYGNQFQDVPVVACNYGQGVAGSLYMYPVANAPYQMEADCICIPIDLVDDNTVELIPTPWQDCVQYYAAFKAFLRAQRFADAERMYCDDPKKPEGLFQQFMTSARRNSMPGSVNNWYGRSI